MLIYLNCFLEISKINGYLSVFIFLDIFTFQGQAVSYEFEMQ